MIWATILAKLKSLATWLIVALGVLVLVLLGQIRRARAEVEKQKDRAKRWEQTAKIEAEKAQRAQQLAAEQDKIRKDRDEKVKQVTEVLEAKRADAAAVDKEVHAHVDRTGSAASEAKRLREEIDLEDGGL